MSNQEVIAILKDPNTLELTVKEMMDHFDKDHSGTISKKELKKGLKMLHQLMNDIPEPTDKDVDEVLAAIDVNGDGVIDKNELKTLISALFEAMIAEMQ